jgi:beta-glucosidase
LVLESFTPVFKFTVESEIPLENRIEQLISQMNIEEKISMIAGIDSWHTRDIQHLGIPSIKVTDGPHGDRTIADNDPQKTLPATSFPTGVAMGATWNPELIYRVGQALAEETRERGCAILLGPCVNIHRSPLGGRNFESFSEDPYLSSRITVSYIKGVQSRKVGASVKHFALNNSEYQRTTISSVAEERAMREIYFPSFEKAVKEANTWMVMCSYNKVNGTYASENYKLITEILKQEWGFRGLIMSDWGAVHSVIPAANAGLDLEMPGPARFFGDQLIEAVKNGQVDEKTIDDKVRRILRVLFDFGAFDGKFSVTVGKSGRPEHQKLAREVAGEAIVLLKNEKNILPLSLKKIRSIAVIGPNAATARFGGGGSAAVQPYYSISPLDGFRQRCPDWVQINYEPGCTNNILTMPLNPRYLTAEAGKQIPGLKIEYFDNNELIGQPVFTGADTSFQLRWWGGMTPVPQIKNNDFSMRWTGIFTAPETGEYKFGLLTNGWVRLFVNNKEVCSTWGIDAINGYSFPPEEKIGKFPMDANRSYSIKIEYCKNTRTPARGRSVRIGCDLPLPPDLVERAVTAATRSDVAVIFAGLTDEYESEGFDRKDMDLPDGQEELIEKVAAANPNCVVVLNNGAPVEMASWLHRVPCLVEAWYPGQECGNAIADVLFGDINPSGKLPDTFPRRLEDNPAFINYPGESGKVLYGEGIYVGYRYYDAKKVEPLFPFGYGLSYTSFEYSNLRINPVEMRAGEKINVSLDIKNTGPRQGKEVVQLYIRDVKSSLTRPPKELKGFRKVNFLSGETKTVDFVLDEEALSFYDPQACRWVAEPGEFEVQVGSSSRDIRARQVFTLKP